MLRPAKERDQVFSIWALRLAFRAAEPLNCEQRDCGWVIGHCIPPLGQAGAQNSQSPVDAEEGGDGTSMLFRVRRHRSILLTFKKLMIGKTWPARPLRVKRVILSVYR